MLSRIEEAMEKKARTRRPEGQPEPPGKPASESAAVPAVSAATPPASAPVDARIVPFHRPRSGLTENFKQIRIMIHNMLPEGHNRILMFTSSTGDEGKTTAALNFATAVAQDARRRTLIVDADMRDPKVHLLLGMRSHAGFGDLLMSDAPAEGAVVSTPVPGLSAILCGELPPSPGELLGSERARQLFAELKENYDCVIVDTPPVLPVVDTVNLSPLADGVILIVEAARTPRKKVQRAVHLLNNANASVMGFLLNKDVSSLAEYAGSGEYDGR